MNFLRIVSCLFAIVNAVRCSTEVPVLAWGNGLEHTDFHIPALRKLSTSEFHEDVLKKVIRDESPAMVLFVKKSLSPEDLGSMDTDEKSAYPLLRETIESQRPASYFPYVSDPLKAVEMLDYEKHKLSLQGSPTFPKSAKVFFVVKLQDSEGDESRLESLQRHDKIIHELCSKIQEKYEKVVCMLTAEQPSWSEPERKSRSIRQLLQSTDDASGNKDVLNVYYKSDIGMVYTKYPPIMFIKNKKQASNLTYANGEIRKENNALVVPLSNGITLAFDFIPPNMTSTWQLDSVTITDNGSKTSQLKSNVSVSASLGNSFHSPSNVTFYNENYQLTFRGLQIQYFDKAGSQTFGQAEDTVYFFTIPILSGLFVTSLLVTIVLIGLTMIFDIRTMDQFDDPKGKSITINASE